jgi:GMP synthase-like glutamine amidotransferase
MKILILQHIECETPGYIKDLMLSDGFNLTTVELDVGERIPDNINQFDGMFCMGGPMDTWMIEKYPWIVEEKKKIKEFVVDFEKPFLGFCLGCQFLGEVVGGEVVKSTPPEIGILEINMEEQRINDQLFSTFPKTIKALQWHSYEVVGLENNNNITLLASSSTTKYQIFKYKENAYGIQFHIEIKSNTVNDWGCVPEYKNALEDSLGLGALEKFEKVAAANMQDMNKQATMLYKNFCKLM